MTRATEVSLSASKKQRQEQRDAMESTRTNAKTSSSTFHRTGLKRSAYGKGSSYSQ